LSTPQATSGIASQPAANKAPQEAQGEPDA